ncbi:ligase-associated DNA damage response endonuclease PdeM [bacterium]|nr:MAG: ligase-associated DNA damage response endonuclease PdeM [bacterium]
MTPIVEIEVVGERLLARGDRTLYWPAERTMFVADLHLGKGASFRASGLPIPAGSTQGTLDALGRAVEEAGAERLVVLGDLWHARSGRTEENRELLARWREVRPELRTSLVIGNHDRGAGWELEAVPPGEALGPFRLHHFPDPDPAGYVLSGHLHPGYRLDGKGGQSLRLPCFWFGQSVGVLPAFGELTGAMEIRPRESDRIVVVAEGRAALVPMRDRFRARWR